MLGRAKVAAIMDEFTYSCYAPECELLQLTPDGYEKEIDALQPDLLFLESAWQGKDGLWYSKLAHFKDEIPPLIKYCRARGIPTVFWSKEDPVYFNTFLRLAAEVDYVFTTDADCIPKYKIQLKHDRVYFLPFAAQPKLHNPIEEYDRKDRFCFAGTFYAKYKKRSEAFLELAPLLRERGLDIYDREIRGSDGSLTYPFPPEFEDCISGSLPYSRISLAYKGYRYGVNMTSMVQSGYMFARRVFELLACNTVTVSNYSRGIHLLFGDLVIGTNNQDAMKERLSAFCGTDVDYQRFRLAGLRHVLSEHLYEDRLDRIAQKVLGKSTRRAMPEILVVCFEESDRVRRMFENQSYAHKRLVVADSDLRVGELSFDFLTVFSPEDYYGKNYLLDFALATRFSDSQVLGKGAYFEAGCLRDEQKVYTRMEEPVELTRQMAAKAFFDPDMMLTELESFHPAGTILSLDGFNYCKRAAECAEADDPDFDTGIPLTEVYRRTDSVRCAELQKAVAVPVCELFREVRIQDGGMVTGSLTDRGFTLERTAEDNQVVWLRTEKNYSVSEFVCGNNIMLNSEVLEKQGNVRGQIEYYDKTGTKLAYYNFSLGEMNAVAVSQSAETFKLIFRLQGKVRLTLKSMEGLLYDRSCLSYIPLRSGALLTESYPDYSSRDAGALLHQFARRNRLEVIVARAEICEFPYSEYDDIPVVSSCYDLMPRILEEGDFREIFVYGPSPELLRQLESCKGTVRELSDADLGV